MIVLDTHAFLWWLHAPGKLSKAAREAIHRSVETDEVRLSAISIWEVAVKHALGKLTLPTTLRAWHAHATTFPGYRMVPVDGDLAIESVELPGELHRDPADRLIVATARRLDARLVTKDKKLVDYPHIETIW
ncbi:MAG: type II toxin-antitoxin system VapC family toxin [Myxococcales bacterium]|nr:type II toxin-antitoxin system VapC family toxin [Myxococcales bacterium]